MDVAPSPEAAEGPEAAEALAEGSVKVADMYKRLMN